MKTAQDTTELHRLGGFCFTEEFGVVRVTGADATQFLESQTTNQVKALNDGEGQLSCLLDRKARPVGCFHIYRDGAEYDIVSERFQIDGILAHLEKFHFADKVKFDDISSDTFQILLLGRRSRSLIKGALEETLSQDFFKRDFSSTKLLGVSASIYRMTLTGEEGFLIVVPRSETEKFRSVFKQMAQKEGVPEVTAELIEMARIEGGSPKFKTDFDEENLLPETTLDESSVSYTKGCFQGQEVLARVRGFGAPTKALVGFVLKPAPQARFPMDAAIVHDGQTIGSIKSSAESKFLQKYIAMAMMKREFRVPGKTLSVTIEGEIFEGTVQLLPFYKPPAPEVEAKKLYNEALQLFASEAESSSDTPVEDSDSVRLLREALSLDPLCEDAYEALGVILSKRGKLDEAIELMEYLAKLNPDSVMSHTNLSVFYVEKGWKEKAEDEKAISMSIRMRQAAEQMAKEKETAAAAQESKEEAKQRMEMFRQVLAIDSEDLLANYGLGDCLIVLGDFAEASKYLKKAIDIKPTHSVAYLALGRAYEGLSDKESACRTYEKGIEIAAQRGDMEPLKKMQALKDNLTSTV
jgi:folate-binding protein YgfZ